MPTPIGGGETTANGSIPSDGSDPFKLNNHHNHHHHHHHHHNNNHHNHHTTRDSRVLPNIMSFSPPITLKFIDLTYKLKLEPKPQKGTVIGRCMTGQVEQSRPSERTILDSITGMAHPGELLAVLGPSGSGKSTLLNAVTGRLHGRGCTGTILANDKPFNRSVQRNMGFVAQDDVLFPHLTVRETLVFCSLLRLPASLTAAEKKAAAESVMTELGLDKCAATMVGNGFVRGVSGGERKRVSIAHELLLNPSLIVLDEPTSGLDATAAHRLVATLAGLASQRGKTVVASVHQPSSRVFQMFDAVLVLSEGRCVYFGRGRDAMRYFDSLGYRPSFPMNPADFLLDLANGVFQHDGLMGERENKGTTNTKQALVSSYNKLVAPKIKALCMETTSSHSTKPNSLSSSSSSLNTTTITKANLSTWLSHFTTLLRRSIKERRHESFNSLRVFQVITAAILSGVMWWHSDPLDVQDRLGLLFFIAIFWGVLPSFNAVFAFPQERAILLKERASGMYSLSSYFMARVVGDAPAELVLPTLFLLVAYWMAGLRPEPIAFILTLLILLSYVLVSQGLGLALGAIIMDAKKASTLVTVIMLAFVLTGGFYVHKVPYCLSWVKYISTTFYTYRLLINVQYGDGDLIAAMLGCSDHHQYYHHHHHSYDSDGFRANCKFITDDVAGQINPLVSVGVMMLMFFGYRILAYLALRRIKP